MQEDYLSLLCVSPLIVYRNEVNVLTHEVDSENDRLHLCNLRDSVCLLQRCLNFNRVCFMVWQKVQGEHQRVTFGKGSPAC